VRLVLRAEVKKEKKKKGLKAQVQARKKTPKNTNLGRATQPGKKVKRSPSNKKGGGMRRKNKIEGLEMKLCQWTGEGEQVGCPEHVGDEKMKRSKNKSGTGEFVHKRPPFGEMTNQKEDRKKLKQKPESRQADKRSGKGRAHGRDRQEKGKDSAEKEISGGLRKTNQKGRGKDQALGLNLEKGAFWPTHFC